MVLYYLIFVPTFIKAPQYIYALMSNLVETSRQIMVRALVLEPRPRELASSVLISMALTSHLFFESQFCKHKTDPCT